MFFRKNKKKKQGNLKLKLIGIAIIAAVVLCIVMVLTLGSMSMFQTGTVSMNLWGDEIHEIPEEESDKCECGCVWVTNENGTQSVTVNTGTVANVGGLQSMKLLGKAVITTYGFGDNDKTNPDGSVGSGSDETVSGVPAQIGLTTAVGYKREAYLGGDHENTRTEKVMGYSDSDKLCYLQEIWNKKVKNEYGGKGNTWMWIYIEGIGVRAVLDKCGVGSALDVYTAEDDPDYSAIKALDGNTTNVYYLGDIDNLNNLTPPTVNISSVQVPSYGASTGSLTNTSNTATAPKYSGQRKEAVDKLLPGAVAAEQYFNVRVLMSLCHAMKEGGYKFDDRVNNHGYNMYGIQVAGFDETKLTHSNGVYKHNNNHSGVYFRSYESFSESVIDHARLMHDSKYKQVIDEYNNGWEAQVKALQGTPYLGGGTNESYINLTLSFVKQLKQDWSPLNDLNVCFKYMEENGLMDEYYKAVDIIKNTPYYGSVALSTPNTSNSVSGASGATGSTSTSNGYWLCACKRPCKLCHCHDNENDNGNNTNTDIGSNGMFPAPQAGTASGLWGTASQLASYIDELNSSNMPLGCGNVNQLKNNLKALLPLMGTNSVKPFTYAVDKFTGADGIGFVSYSQSGSYAKETFHSNSYNDGTSISFASSGCGIYSTAMVLSTLEKKWVNPAEVAIALQTYGVRNNKRISTTCMGSSGAAVGTGLKALIEEAGYTVKIDTASINMSTVDDCLDKGGCVIYVVGASSGLTTGGHYVVVREKTDDGSYLMGNSTRMNNNEFSKAQIKSYVNGNYTLYIYPKTPVIKNPIGNTIGSTSPFVDLINSNTQTQLVAEANKHLGVKYVYGGSTPSGFDCSGLIQYCYNQVGKSIPRTSSEQYKGSKKITVDELQPGDLVFGSSSGSTSNITHVMMYIGNGQVIHAPQTGDVVKIINLSSYKNTVAYGTYLR